MGNDDMWLRANNELRLEYFGHIVNILEVVVIFWNIMKTLPANISSKSTMFETC
jgi:hypothetical protein